MKKKLLLGIAVLSAACIAAAACAPGVNDGYYGSDEAQGNVSSGGGNYAPSGPAGGTVIPGGIGGGGSGADGSAGVPGDNYVYGDILEQGFTEVKKQASSYFSLDRNTATYTLVRRQIENGYGVSPLSVRVEEMINYFDYDFASPEDKAVGVSTYLTNCPWNADNKLLMTGLKTAEYDLGDVNANYVFLIDVSGSMSGDNRIGLAKKGLNYLLDGLGEKDLVSVVTYASGVETVIDGGECSENGKNEIRSEIKKLTAGGYTSGGDGLQRAYNIAREHFITGGNNRIILISDGDFNAGISDPVELKEFIQEQAKSGVYLSVLGVGLGNMRDDMLETLATCGNGNYAYLDNETEAKKVFCDELSGTLKTVAKDAKASVTFTQNVDKYRLIGYDTKIISEDDFNNEKADTGELGSNLCVVALYEITLAENASGKLADVEVRFKDVTGESETSDSVTAEVTTDTSSSNDLEFAGCVAEFGLILRQSEHKGTASYAGVLARLNDLQSYISGDLYKEEFVTLVGKASEKV